MLFLRDGAEALTTERQFRNYVQYHRWPTLQFDQLSQQDTQLPLVDLSLNGENCASYSLLVHSASAIYLTQHWLSWPLWYQFGYI